MQNVQSTHALFRNTFKPPKMWTALETVNPIITSSVSVYSSSSCRMKNQEAPYHSRLVMHFHTHAVFKLQEELLPHFILLSASCHPEIFNIPIFSPPSIPEIETHNMLLSCVFRSLSNFSSFTS